LRFRSFSGVSLKASRHTSTMYCSRRNDMEWSTVDCNSNST
jgi:hypothetical protein